MQGNKKLFLSQSKRGYTLVEVLCVLMLLSIGISMALYSIEYVVKTTNKVNKLNIVNSIIEFIDNSKLCCKVAQNSGTIYYFTNGNYLEFRLQNKSSYQSRVYLTEDTAVENINTSTGYISINNEGIIVQGCTINFNKGLVYDKKKHSVTIYPVTGFIELKEYV